MHYVIVMDLLFWTHRSAHFMQMTEGVTGELRRTPTTMPWLPTHVRHSGVSIVTHIGCTRVTMNGELTMRTVGNTACPAGGLRIALALQLCPFLIIMFAWPQVALIEFVMTGEPMGPPRHATHFVMKLIVSAARGERSTAMRRAPYLVAVLAVTGLTFRAIMRWVNTENGPLPSESGGTRGRAVLLPSGWNRRPGCTCLRRASWAAGKCAEEKIVRSTLCTAAAAWGTRPPLPR